MKLHPTRANNSCYSRRGWEIDMITCHGFWPQVSRNSFKTGVHITMWLESNSLAVSLIGHSNRISYQIVIMESDSWLFCSLLTCYKWFGTKQMFFMVKFKTSGCVIVPIFIGH